MGAARLLAGCAARHAEARSTASLLLLTLDTSQFLHHQAALTSSDIEAFSLSERKNKLNNKRHMISDFIIDCCDSTASLIVMQQ